MHSFDSFILQSTITPQRFFFFVQINRSSVVAVHVLSYSQCTLPQPHGCFWHRGVQLMQAKSASCRCCETLANGSSALSILQRDPGRR